MLRHLLLTLLFTVALLNSIAQDDIASIIHYQNKVKTNNIIKTNDPFNQAIFKINVPKEIYNSGEITVKKFYIGKVKSSAKLVFHKEVYTHVTYTLSSKKNFEKMKAILEISEIEMEKKLVKDNIVISYTRIGRKYVLTIKKLA